eukprot:TRINITY_DN561_c0_g1_i1.p1 TRINITY_DN561_c0_g1~~TRINITY_DN561_c0_g1_i1.p1  ORF type:complete len:338 (-),score=77.67 TRINITY_DN561_c0_g1_i1:20-1033(-)
MSLDDTFVSSEMYEEPNFVMEVTNGRNEEVDRVRTASVMDSSFEPNQSSSISVGTFTDVSITDGYTFTPSDDNLLKDGIESGLTFNNMLREYKFSTKFPVTTLRNRWKMFLYNPSFCEIATKRMRTKVSLGKRVKWSDEEEFLLCSGVQNESLSFPKILRLYRNKFHPTRTPKSLEAHYYKLKRNNHIPEILAKCGSRKTGFLGINDPSRQTTSLEMLKFQVPSNVLLGFIGFMATYFVELPSAIIGKSTKSDKVHIDLTKEMGFHQISVHQSFLKLNSKGKFEIMNRGEAELFVNDLWLPKGNIYELNNGDILRWSTITLKVELFQENIDRITKIH